MWKIVGIVFIALLVLISVATTIGLALVRDRSEKRDLVYGPWYWNSRMIGKPISTREPRFVVVQAVCALVMIALLGLMIWGRPDQRPLVFILAFAICAVQVSVALKLRLNYVKADDTRQWWTGGYRHSGGRRDYTGEHPQPIRPRIPQG